MKIRKSESNRVFALVIFLLVWAVAIGAALVKTQVFDYSENIAHVRKQSNRTFSLHPKRGTIYDSKGEVLAISVKAESAFLSNESSRESLEILKKIREKIRFHDSKDKNWQTLVDIRKRIKEGKKFIWIKRKLKDSEYESIKDIKVGADYKSKLNFLEEYKRVYPQGAIASHVLGGVGIDEQGLAGIEFGLDSIIKGKGSKIEVLIDARKKKFSQEFLIRPVPGKDIYLTIDSAVQFFVERELRKTVKKYKARGGCVVVMNSKDASILAMAGYPDYTPDRISETSNWLQKNRGVSFLYHPGSTFKIILAATALENNACYPQQTFDCCNGVFRIKNETIYDEHPADRLTFEEIIIQSSNIGAARIGKQLGKKRYYQGIKNFGFGDETNIRLPGEERGILRPLRKWSGVSVAFLAHGYEILVTPLQMTRAFNVLASGGYLERPFIVRKIEDTELKKDNKTKILSSSTIKRLTSIMTRVIKIGTGKKARIEGIEIAGKTGTTKKMKGKGGKEKFYVSSFGGYLPAENPRITMFIVIDEPKGAFYGSDVAAPLFKSIAEKLVIYLNIFPELDKKNEIRI
jgi:cell division protein FtsI/penicillin-binding protein 2